jgi:general secretion pathway protein D
VLIRSLSQQKGVDLMSAPRITARSGQQARLEIVREFVYPDEAEAGKQVTVNPSVTLAVLPKMTADNQITLDLSPQVTEFEGFAAPKKNADSPVITRTIFHADGTTTESVSDGDKGEVSESKFNARGELLSKKTVPSSEAAREPIFTVRKIHVDAAMTSGQTIVLEMDSRTDKQLVQETNENGDVISSKTVLYHRRLFVFVTADLVDSVTGKLRAP